MSDGTLTWHTEQRKVSELLPFEKNPRTLTEKQAEDLKKSLQRFNLVEIPAIDKDNRIVAGHQRVKIMQLLGRGQETIDVRIPNRKLSEKEFIEYNLRSNQNTGSWVDDLLAGIGEDVLKDVGFSPKELDRILDSRTKKEDDESPDLPVEPKAKRGEIYHLGNHRIMCGDSTDPSDIQKLMGMAGRQAGMVFTDPPYNVDYSGRGEETSTKILNDSMSEDSFRAFLLSAFKNLKTILSPSGALYCCYASRTHREFEDALNGAGFEVRNQIIWVKLVASMGWGDYRWKHEPILYCHQKGAGKMTFYGDRSQYTAWEEQKTDEELLAMFKKMIEKEEHGNSTVWRFNRESNYKHPTTKPVDLIMRALHNSSERGDIVADLFLGSGSTLIACEKSGRTCMGMELDPRFIDVIIQRWQDFTGHAAVKL